MFYALLFLSVSDKTFVFLFQIPGGKKRQKRWTADSGVVGKLLACPDIHKLENNRQPREQYLFPVMSFSCQHFADQSFVCSSFSFDCLMLLLFVSSDDSPLTPLANLQGISVLL